VVVLCPLIRHPWAGLSLPMGAFITGVRSMGKLSEFKRYIRSRYMPRYARAEVAEFLRAARGPKDDDAEDADEGYGGDAELFYDALDRVHAEIMPMLGTDEDTDDAVRRLGVV